MTDMVKLDISPTGLIIKEALTQDEWVDRVEWHVGVQIVNPVILGDLINYGKERWPDTWEDLLPDWISERKKQTLRNWGSVMRRVPRAVLIDGVTVPIRQEGLTISHLDAVRALPPLEQKELLELAVEGDVVMGRDELRDLAAERLGRDVPCRIRGTGWLKFMDTPKGLRWLIEPLQTEGEIEEGEVWLSLRNTNS